MGELKNKPSVTMEVSVYDRDDPRGMVDHLLIWYRKIPKNDIFGIIEYLFDVGCLNDQGTQVYLSLIRELYNDEKKIKILENIIKERRKYKIKNVKQV